jgi:hypothetical protein
MATLQGGLKASEREGTPFSAKFESDGGKLQLSVYMMKRTDFMEFFADSTTGDRQSRESHGQQGPQGGFITESCDGQSESALLTETAVEATRGPGGQHLP